MTTTTFASRAHEKSARAMLDATRYASLGALLHDALVQFKSEVALVEVDRTRETQRLRYVDVKRRAERLARELAALGVGAGDRVALAMSNQSAWPVTALAVFFRGAVLVPLDYKLTAPEREALLAHCKPSVLVTEWPLFAQHAPGALAGVTHLLVSEAPAGAALGAARRFELEDDGAAALPLVPRGRDDVATIVYSSGTGGTPKGCMLPHGAYLAQLDALVKLYPLTRGDRWFSILPTNHAIDFMCGLVGPFSGGATVVHQRTLRPEFLLDTMRTQRITHMAVVPLILAAFERAIRERIDALPPWQRAIAGSLATVNGRLTERAPNRAVSKLLLRPVHEAFGGELRVLFCGGAFVEEERARFFYELGLPVVIGYGLTEACTVATVHDLQPFRADSVGRAVDGVEVVIASPDAHGVGEVWLRGPTLMKGYLDAPELTAEAIDADGFLHTGDLGRLDASGHLHLVGRAKNMIVTRGGKNVYPEDVEGAFGAVPCEELIVTARDYVWPREGALTEEALVVVVRTKDDGQRAATRAALVAASRRLVEHKRVASVLFTHEAFPRTASMKVKRHALAAALAAAHAPDELEELPA